MERVKAIKNHDGLCWKCLKSHHTSENKKIVIPMLAYGGGYFDGFGTEIHLCESCYNESIKDNPQVWDLETIQCEGYIGEYFTEYKYEKEMTEYIEDLPLQGRQFVENEFSVGNPRILDAQDWIDDELGILPTSKLYEYGYELV